MNENDVVEEAAGEEESSGAERFSKKKILRILTGGALMGTADVVPGVSGGTMLVATGLYDNFIGSVADVSRFKFSRGAILFLVFLGLGDVTAILTMSGVVEWGLTNFQHIMFALFIGLTLGGVPLLAKSIRPFRGSSVVGMFVGFLFMIAISFALRELNLPINFAILFMGGFVASSAMVLPGISGSYLLLMMGLYSPILTGVSEFKDALKAMDVGGVLETGFGIGVPVALGVVCGVVLLTNTVKFVLHKYHEATVGVLLGLLLGSVVALFPFRAPGENDLFEEAAAMNAINVGVVLGCIVVGFALTMAIGRLGGEGGGTLMKKAV